MSDDLAMQLRALQNLRALLGKETYQVNLQKLRDQFGAAAVDALLEAAQVSSSERSHTQVISSGQVGVAITGDVYGHIYLAGNRTRSAEELLMSYLRRLAKRCGILPLQGVREQKSAADILSISLDQVYTQLTTVSNQFVTQVIATNKNLVLLGEPGSGKSTVLRYLAINLAQAGLNDQYNLDKQIEGWKDLEDRTHLLPILLPLLPFAKRLASQAGISDHVNYLWNYIADHLEAGGRHSGIAAVILDELEAAEQEASRIRAEWVAERKAAETRLVHLKREVEAAEQKANRIREQLGTVQKAAEAKIGQTRTLEVARTKLAPPNERMQKELEDVLEIRQRLKVELTKTESEVEEKRLQELQGPKVWRVLLLLDGLDEVAGDKSRRDIIRAVQTFAEAYPQCRIVVTCRVRAYEGERNRGWQLPGWPTAMLADWTINQMKLFISAWYNAAARASGMPTVKRNKRIIALQRAVRNRPDLQRLSARPLLLTIMALVHLNDGRLPEDRVSLYSRCLDILLAQWEIAGKDETLYGTLMDYIGLPDADVKSLRPLLSRAAFLAHGAAEPGSPGRLGRADLREMVAQTLADRKHPNPWDGATRFLEYTDVRAGLLQASEAGDAYAFPHQTFQEYLAGLELVRGVEFVERIMQRRNDDRWRVPILLGIGHLVSEGALAMPYQLLSELLLAEERTTKQLHADLIFAAEIVEDVSWDRLERGGTMFKKLRRDLAMALAQVIEGHILSASDHVRAGLHLSILGDPRPGVCSLPPAMARIEGNNIALENENPSPSFTFEISRYLVTNAQFGEFVDDNGYNPEHSWWDDTAKQWLLREQVCAPRYWNNERFGIYRANHPVIGVSWYEAVAFCRWLSHHSIYNPEGYIYRLPAAKEWDNVAIGNGDRTYPWGVNEPDAERANFDHQYNGTTAVGCFPLGATLDGIMDMAGNVWEWTNSIALLDLGEAKSRHRQSSKSSAKLYAIRGGGWDDKSINLHIYGRHAPIDQRRFLGFRLVRCLPG